MSAKTIVLTEENWPKEIEGLEFPGLNADHVASLLSAALRTQLKGGHIRDYPRTTPDEFEDIVTFHIVDILVSMKDGGNRTYRPSMDKDLNHRHFVLRRVFERKERKVSRPIKRP